MRATSRTWTTSSRTVAREARDGDLVVVMSNGGFDNIHQKLLAALESAEPPLSCPFERRMRRSDRPGWRRGAARGAARAHRSRAERARASQWRDALAAPRSARSFATSSSATARSTVYFDPLRRDAEWLEREVRRERRTTRRRRLPPQGPLVDVPVCYGGELGPDLADVAAFAGVLRGRGDRPPRGPRVSRLRRRLHPRLCLHGRSRSAHRRPAPSVAADARAGGVGRASPAGRPASIRP